MDNDNLAYNIAYSLYLSDIIEEEHIFTVTDIIKNEMDKQDLLNLE